MIDGDGRISACVDGDGSAVNSTEPTAPWACALDPRMADGFSLALLMSGVGATIR